MAKTQTDKTAPKPTGPYVMEYLCGFCAVRAQDVQHTHCPGAIVNNGRIAICPCGCKPNPMCVVCKRTDDVDPNTWRCIDLDGCEARMEAKRANDPVMIQIREIVANAHAQVAETRAGRVRWSSADGGEPKAKKTPKPVPALPGKGRCECGCGGPTGSRFVVGHDMRLKSSLKKAWLDGDVEAGAELAARGGAWAKLAPGATEPSEPAQFVADRVADRLRTLDAATVGA